MVHKESATKSWSPLSTMDFPLPFFDINPETLNKAKTRFGCKVFEVDVSIESDVKQALSQLHTLDVLINNAGIWKPELLKNLDIATQKTVWETNVIGTLNCTKHALPILQEKDSSCIINLTSAASRTNSPDLECMLLPNQQSKH